MLHDKLAKKKLLHEMLKGFWGNHFRCSKVFTLESKGQLIAKANCQAREFFQKRTNEFVFTTMQRVFVHFWKKLKTPKRHFEIIWPLVRTLTSLMIYFCHCQHMMDATIAPSWAYDKFEYTFNTSKLTKLVYFWKMGDAN